MLRRWRSSKTWAATKPWCAAFGLFGVGMLPCPDCGAPIALHYWPIGLLLALQLYVRRKYGAHHSPPCASDVTSAGENPVDLA